MKILVATIFCAASFTCSAGEWEVTKRSEKMTGGETITARIQSENSLDLDFPYRGENYGYLAVRKHPTWGTDVFFSVNKGQILCGYRNCSVRIRFDDSVPVVFQAVGPEDHYSAMVFLRDTKRFLKMASKAKTILVEAKMFHNGTSILEFSPIAALVWPPKKASASGKVPAELGKGTALSKTTGSGFVPNIP